MLPARRVEGHAPEAPQPRNIGSGRPTELPHAAHHDLGVDRLALGGAEAPHARVGVEPCGRDLDGEADVGEQVVFACAVPQIVQDLPLGRPLPRPVGLLFERETVHERRRVTRRAGVGVVTPRAAESVGLLEDREGVDAGLLEPDAHAQATEAGPDDDDAERKSFQRDSGPPSSTLWKTMLTAWRSSLSSRSRRSGSLTDFL